MQWFGYIWIVILVILWLIWTIKCVVDFIGDVRYVQRIKYSGIKLIDLIEDWPSWLVYIIVHTISIFIVSLIYFISIGGMK